MVLKTRFILGGRGGGHIYNGTHTKTAISNSPGSAMNEEGLLKFSKDDKRKLPGPIESQTT